MEFCVPILYTHEKNVCSNDHFITQQNEINHEYAKINIYLDVYVYILNIYTNRTIFLIYTEQFVVIFFFNLR